MASPQQTADQPWPDDIRLVPPVRMTEEEFVAWCDEDTRAEWVDGEVIMASPASNEHMDLSLWLGAVIRSFVERRQLGTVRIEVQVRLARPRRRRNPDIWFVSKEREHFLKPNHLEGPPDLIAEIVSPESEARDWREKYLEYEAAGVREYWVIDPASQHAELYVLTAEPPAEGEGAGEKRYRRVLEKDGVLASVVLPGFFVRIAWLWQPHPQIPDALHELGLLGPAQQ